MRCEHVDESSDGRLLSPSAKRNKEPILRVLERILPDTGSVLEIASGTGEHVVHFAQALGGLHWQPSDLEEGCRRSISAWLATADLPNIRPPLELDVCQLPWPVPAVDAIVCINLIHIAPWTTTTALMAGANSTLRAGGLLYLYGPYSLHGRHTAQSNEAFDAALRAANRAWGVRDLDDVTRVAQEEGLDLAATIEMPANNLSVLFRKR